ncbi:MULTISPECIES: Ig-like domain-containing protein, partial [unclassified Ruegeria]|uniref:Ig-like domain-containing protein n=1 Tax=unclassified Ruegeria TaxID=2625375 RepID=UPI001492B48C
DLALTNATATLSGSGSNYTATLTAQANGLVELSIPAGVFTDAAGNANLASNVVNVIYDANAPTATIGALTATGSDTFQASITLSDPSTDFSVGDLALTNATATLSGSGSNYTATLTAQANGLVELSIPAGVFTDAAGNANLASNVVNVIYDANAPKVTISGLPPNFTDLNPITVTFTFSEEVTNFSTAGISVTNGTIGAVSGGPQTYMATVTPSGSGNLSLVVLAGAAVDLAGNPSVASDQVTVVNEIVADTRRLIQAFQNARATSLATNQPGLTRFLQRSGSGVLDTSVTRGSGYLNFASDPSNPVWFNLTGNWSSQDDFDSSYALAVLGAHRQINANLLIGAMLQLDYAETDNGPASVDGTGWLIGPYVVAKLPSQPVFFEGRALYGQADNDISPLGTYTDSFDSERWLVQSRVTGEIKRGALTLMPLLDVSYASDDQESYTDSLGNLIPQQDFSLTTARLGMDFKHPVQVSRGDFMLTGGLSGIWSTTSGTGTVPGVTPIGDTARARADLGFDYLLENNSLLAANVFYDGIGESGFENYSLSLIWQMSF